MNTPHALYIVVDAGRVASRFEDLPRKLTCRTAVPVPWRDAVAAARAACGDCPGRTFELLRVRRRGEPLRPVGSPRTLTRAVLAHAGHVLAPAGTPRMRAGVLEEGRGGLPWPLDADGWPREPG